MLSENLKYLFGYNVEEPMLFNSGMFFFLFTIFLAGYSFLYHNKKIRIIYILIFSMYFYFKSSGFYILVLCGTVLADYFISLELARLQDQGKRKLLLVTSIILNVGFLFYFKYTNFFCKNIAELFGARFSSFDIFLPIGVSFYTFQSLSYIIDVYKREIKPAENFYDYAFYMTFFPHLVAGPIVRAKFFLPQIYKDISYNAQQVSDGFYLIVRGLIKKAIIADYISQYNDFVFNNPTGYSEFECTIAMYSYAIQIFCDFSGYSDIAIGIAKLMGYELGDNFNSPYKSTSLTEFWRRWHISLSSWLRDYIYIPLGGNRNGTKASYIILGIMCIIAILMSNHWLIVLSILFSLGLVLTLLFIFLPAFRKTINTNINLFITMLIGGFWHGPSWNFVFWGGMHGLGLFGDKLVKKFTPEKISNSVVFKIFGWLITFHFVAFLWVFFRLGDFSTAWMMVKKDIHGMNYFLQGLFESKKTILEESKWELILHVLKARWLILACVFIVLAIGFISEKMELSIFKQLEKTNYIVKFVLLLLIVQLILNTQSAEVKPFIYFQF